MARFVVMASGGGGNFQALAEAATAGDHSLAGLICDRPGAFCLARADRLNIPGRHISYFRRNREEAEEDILAQYAQWRGDLLVLAGFMRLLTPRIIDALPRRIVNIHPSLLPKYPGTRGIREGFDSGDPELGITIHYVDHGMDSGPMIRQERIPRGEKETLEEAEERIHALEHRCYPETVLQLLDNFDGPPAPSNDRTRENNRVESHQSSKV